MIDPVNTADGQTYEREAIVEWLKSHSTSPATNVHLESSNVVPNLKLREAIRAWQKRHPNFSD